MRCKRSNLKNPKGSSFNNFNLHGSEQQYFPVFEHLIRSNWNKISKVNRQWNCQHSLYRFTSEKDIPIILEHIQKRNSLHLFPPFTYLENTSIISILSKRAPPNLKMERHQRMHQIFHDWLQTLFIAVGHNIFDRDFKRNSWTYFLYFVFALYFVSAYYTFMKYDWTIAVNLFGYCCVAAEVWNHIYDKNGNLFVTKSFLYFIYRWQLLIKIYSVRYGQMIMGLVLEI